MATVQLNTEQIIDWASFHRVCKEAFGFPEFYGANMNAWIDCLSYLDDSDGMSRFNLSKDEKLVIEITNTKDFNLRLPEIFDALVECSAFVNNRHLQNKNTPKIVFLFL